MSRQKIQAMVNAGKQFTRFAGAVGAGVFLHTQATVDSFEFTVRVLDSDVSPDIRISFYRFDNGIVKALTSFRISEWRARITQDLTIGDFFIEVEANCRIELEGIPLNFVSVKTFVANCYHSYDVVFGLATRKRPRECSESLHYELIDGALPPGIHLNKDGLLIGVVDELDCIDDSMSPSFNWYYDNHDGVAQAWGRKWRFKVRVSLANQRDVFSDEWFCLRVFNNWSIDRDSFTESDDTVVYNHHSNIVMPAMPTLCDIPSETVFVPERQITELPRYNRAADCVPCNDPTTPHETEHYMIPVGLRIRSPNELIRYYIDNQNNFEPLVMNLHNSILFGELLKQLGKEDPRIVFELNITDSKITIKKFWLDNGSALNDTDAIVIANRTITGQVNPIDIVGYNGEHMTGELTW